MGDADPPSIPGQPAPPAPRCRQLPSSVRELTAVPSRACRNARASRSGDRSRQRPSSPCWPPSLVCGLSELLGGLGLAVGLLTPLASAALIGVM
ncbi:DoxX family membrane protein, partial [Streptomyces sp. NPDC001215]